MEPLKMDDIQISIVNSSQPASSCHDAVLRSVPVTHHSPRHDAVLRSVPVTHHSPRHVIKCFRHCSQFIFCYEFPDFCPACGEDLLKSELIVPPFIYQSPLDHREHRKQPAILVKPSKGKSFLHDYSNGDYLHCGILDEDGIVHDFDENGLHVSTEWLNCVNIPLTKINSSNDPIKHHIVKLKGDWTKQHSRYDSVNANCFTFMLFCLKSQGYYVEMDETEFITKVIMPRTSEAAKYISLYRQIAAGGGTYVKMDD